MTKTEYAEYLASDRWKKFRDTHLETIPHCERCKMPWWLAGIVYDQDLHLHHKTYRNRGKELREDMEVLCRRCHELETFGHSELRSPKAASCSCCADVHWNYRSDFCEPCRAILKSAHLRRMAAVEYLLDGVKHYDAHVQLALSMCEADTEGEYVANVLYLIAGLSVSTATQCAWKAKRRA